MGLFCNSVNRETKLDLCVAGVISKYKSRIKYLAPLEDNQPLLVSTSTLKMGSSIKIGLPLKQKGQTPDLHHILPCKPLSLFQQLTYQVAIPWHSSCENGSLDAITVAVVSARPTCHRKWGLTLFNMMLSPHCAFWPYLPMGEG